jgi:hypothetical protein
MDTITRAMFVRRLEFAIEALPAVARVHRHHHLLSLRLFVCRELLVQFQIEFQDIHSGLPKKSQLPTLCVSGDQWT